MISTIKDELINETEKSEKMYININLPPKNSDIPHSDGTSAKPQKKVKRTDFEIIQKVFDKKLIINIPSDKTESPDKDCKNGSQEYDDEINTSEKEDLLSGTIPMKGSIQSSPLEYEKLNTAKSDNISCNSISDYIMERHKFIFFNGSLYGYNKPIYKRLNDHDAITTIRKLLPRDLAQKIKTAQLNEILSLIKTTPEIQRSAEDFKINDRYICFRNKVYDLNNDRLIKHSSDNYFFSYVDVDYNPDEVGYGAAFEKYLDKCTGSDDALKELIMQIIGYIISNSMDAKALFILVGVPDSGKSKFGELLQNLLGKENCSYVPLQDLPKRFQPAQLCGKRLNLCMDLPDAPIKDLGIVKQLSGDDIIQAEEKYQTSFGFRNEAKLLFGCNNLPPIRSTENAKAFFNRLVLIPFNYAIPKDDQDKKLIDKLLTEKNYIVHKAIKAYKRLRRNNFNFIKCKASSEVAAVYINNSNTAIEFVSQQCIIGMDYKIYGLALYWKYVEYCNDRGFKKEDVLNYNEFSNSLKAHFQIEHGRWRDNNENRNGFIGITLKP